MVADLEELETMDASEVYSNRLSAKEVIFPKENGKLVFPVADGRIRFVGGDQDGTTQFEEKVGFLGESEGSLPPPQYSLPDAGDAGEARSYFWSMSGNFKKRHHVEPKVKLYSTREESYPIALKDIDVSRTAHTNLDVMQESRIDDYWNTLGGRKLSLNCLFGGRNNI